jgi:hypothetical protein
MFHGDVLRYPIDTGVKGSMSDNSHYECAGENKSGVYLTFGNSMLYYELVN